MDKRVAVVTGANRGIGLGIARRLARRGDIQVVLTSRDEAKGSAAANQLRGEGLEVDLHALDVTSERSVKTFAGWLESACKRCDILVNNAGVMLDPRGSRVLDSKLVTWRDTLETNLIGPLLLAQVLVPLMKRNGYGRIVNVSSGQGQLSDMGVGVVDQDVTTFAGAFQPACKRLDAHFTRDIEWMAVDLEPFIAQLFRGRSCFRLFARGQHDAYAWLPRKLPRDL